ncbi:MMPL family transporter [Minwuia sp.]|uniref:MMPL family transporter n=1 Tax=Minwuia sp. TaxID=2493630 RepID=UPI003A8EFB5E
MAVTAAVLVLIILGLRLSVMDVGVDTDIQSILPQTAAVAIEIPAIQYAAATAASRLTFGIMGGSTELRDSAASDLEARLLATGRYVPASLDVAETTAWLRANRYEIACERDINALDQAWGERLARRARVLAFSGVIPLSGVDLTKDPFLLQLRHMECLMATLGVGTVDDSITILTGRLTASPYALDVQADLDHAVGQWQSEARFAELDLVMSGAAVFSADAGARAERDITWVGSISVLLILVLYTLAFGSPLSAGLALTTVAAGTLGGASLCFAVFGQVHFSVFVFGSALTGISADYAVHSLAARRAAILAEHNGGSASVSGLGRALTISMLTSAAGFAALLFFDIEVFRQISIFAIGGLVSAWLFATTLLPRLDRPARDRATGLRQVLRTARLVRASVGRRIWLSAAVLAVAGMSVPGLLTISFIDDVRRFQQPSPQLIADREILHPGNQGQFSARFLLSSGEDRQAALRQEETFLAHSDGSPGSFLAVSRFDPSDVRRSGIRNAYDTHLLGPHMAALRVDLGLDAAHEPLLERASVPRPSWITTAGFEHHGQSHLLAPLLTGSTIDPTTATSASRRLVDPVETYGAALQAYRQQVLTAIVASAVLAALLLTLVYRRAAALWLVVPPLLGCLLAISLQSLLGQPLTLFSTLALFVVLGSGIDFSVFQWEMALDRTGWTGTAVLVAALSTCAAMGMLGFSNTLPVQSFGLTIAVGVLGSMVFSFMLPVNNRRMIEPDEQRV